MEKQRKKRVAMTKELERDVFLECFVRVSRGILPFGSFKAVGEHCVVDPKTVAKLWSSTMLQVNGYQPNLPIDPPFVVSNLPTTAFDTKFQNAGRKPKFELETVFQRIEDVESCCSLRFCCWCCWYALEYHLQNEEGQED
jgi:hypothetical protein